MTHRTLTKRQQLVSDAITYWLSIILYAAAFYYWFDAPGWAALGFALVLARINATHMLVGRRP